MYPHTGKKTRDQVIGAIQLQNGLRVPSHNRARVGHRPGHRGRESPVTVARKLASHVAERLFQYESGRAHIRNWEEGNLVVTRNKRGRDYAADQSPVPYEARA